MRDERRLAIEFVACIKVIDRIHDGIVARNTASKHLDARIVAKMALQDIFRGFDPVLRTKHEHFFYLRKGDEFLNRIDNDRLFIEQ